MNIAFYTPLNTRSRDIESQAAYFKRQGHQVFLLTQNTYGLLHEHFKNAGCRVDADDSHARFVSLRVVKRILRLVRFCWINRIDILYAHLEPCNFIAVLGQYFVRARVVICRHHVDEAKLYGFENDLSYRLTYRLAKEIIVVSQRAKDFMIHHEGIPENRIHVVRLAYDFGLYQLPEEQNVQLLRNKLNAPIVLLTVCRLTRFKRPELSVEVVKKLIERGISAKLIILGKGELLPDLEEKIRTSGLQENCLLPGYVNNVLEYMAASDLLIHPSLLESSCITVKEAGLVQLPVIVCRGVGDFDEVITDRVNGFLTDPGKFVEQTEELVLEYMRNPKIFKETSLKLKQTILHTFAIERVGPDYERLFHN
ncbi:MAG: glycosyltransferase [Cyclobacteriaceae bacterium]|nr:glycosyltransferase [Cyclobacteriaceae bacterium]MDW8331332.1 glycosyltransferase [Cyclobacteriaceae bacterium]